MYDFTKYPIKKKTYSGANGNKISILIDDELISDEHKVFLKKIIKARKEIIIDNNLK